MSPQLFGHEAIPGYLGKCVENKGVRDEVAKEKKLGEAYFVKSTPTYIINGQMSVGTNALESEITKYLQKDKTEQATSE